VLRGTWEPDLVSRHQSPTVNALLALSKDGLKVLGGGLLPTTTINDSDLAEPGSEEHHTALRKEAATGLDNLIYLVVDAPEGRRVLVPTLLGGLAQYSVFRDRDADLLAALKTRAREWFRENEVDPLVGALLLPDNVSFAFLESGPEVAAKDMLIATGHESALLSPSA